LLSRAGRVAVRSTALVATSACLQPDSRRQPWPFGRGGTVGIGLAILTPGVRAAAVAACGLAALPLQLFLPGLVLGSTVFLSLHFVLGYLGGPLVSVLFEAVPLPWLVVLLLALLALGLGVWWRTRRRQLPAASPAQVGTEALAACQEATCPVCLVLGGARRRL
jgi:hypothetical protein